MSELKRKDIDFNNKDVTATEYYFSFTKKDRPEGWTLRDELMLLTLYIQRDLIGNRTGNCIHTIMDWRQNVSKAINETIDKLEDDYIFRDTKIKDWQEGGPAYESYASTVNLSGDILLVFANGKDGLYVKTDKGNQDYERDKLLDEAKKLAKAEILAEQEQAEKEKEAMQKEVVIPLVDYGK